MKVVRGDFKDFGARIKKGAVIFTVEKPSDVKAMSLELYDLNTKKKLKSILLTDEYSLGRVYSLEISELDINSVCYKYKTDGKSFMDPYASSIVGRDIWGDSENRKKHNYKLYCGINSLDESFKDYKVNIEPLDMVMYKAHMRGFTLGSGIKGEGAGNYKGFLRKLKYLKKLGITTLELLPLYDFEELFLENKQIINSSGHRVNTVDFADKINYWGYANAFYFSPKASYFGGAKNNLKAFREFVSKIHENGMELVMEMSFSEVSDDLILDCLHYYVRYFHVDGFHLIGCSAPIERIAVDPYLSDTKIFYEYIDEQILSKEANNKHLFLYNDSFMYVTRQIQNHMNGSMVQFANHMRRQNLKYGFVNYMSSVCGFSLWDSYSYGEKHNLENGEDNRDGNNNNFSFNYGIEGKTNNKLINANRFLQMRNAFSALMLSQSVPLIVAGDEAAATHGGNNNPYCQDNEVGYTVFTKTKNKELLTKFVGELILFRKRHKCIRPENAFSMSDVMHLGLPDLSFHGAEPWSMLIGEEQMSLGVLYNGAYAKENEEVYVCYNFHYDNVSMALPLLEPGKRWRKIFNTYEYNEKSDFNPKPINNQQSIEVPGSSITVLVGLKP